MELSSSFSGYAFFIVIENLSIASKRKVFFIGLSSISSPGRSPKELYFDESVVCVLMNLSPLMLSAELSICIRMSKSLIILSFPMISIFSPGASIKRFLLSR